MVVGTKTGGRKRGTPNKITTHLISILDDHGFNPAAKILKEIKQTSIHSEVKKLTKEVELLEDDIEESAERIKKLKSKQAKDKHQEVVEKKNKKLNKLIKRLMKLEDKLLTTKEVIDISFKFMEYVYPKRRAIEGSLDVGAKSIADAIGEIIDGVDGTTKKGTDK